MLLQLSKTVKQSPKSPQIFENNGTFCADRPFSKNRSETNCQKSFVFNQLVSELQSYILSTTTETFQGHEYEHSRMKLQSYILSTTTETAWGYSRQRVSEASIVHPFNNNWNVCLGLVKALTTWLQSYILSTTTETWDYMEEVDTFADASIVHPFNNNWNLLADYK